MVLMIRELSRIDLMQFISAGIRLSVSPQARGNVMRGPFRCPELGLS